MLTPIFLVLSYFFIPSKSKSTLYLPHYLSLSPLYLWLIVFTLQPHKEERFLFPIYPMITLCGAITIDIIQKLFYRIRNWTKSIKNGSHYLDSTIFIAATIMIISTILGMSRIISIYRNYHAPMDLMMELGQYQTNDTIPKNSIRNLCIGKDWYRFPNSFFFPNETYRIRFLKSDFNGILPAYYSDDDDNGGTSKIHSYFNDLNREQPEMYFNYLDCNYLLDNNNGKYTDNEPNYFEWKEWKLIKTLPFLNAEKSNKFLRAFYVPYLSEKYNIFSDFNLYFRDNK